MVVATSAGDLPDSEHVSVRLLRPSPAGDIAARDQGELGRPRSGDGEVPR